MALKLINAGPSPFGRKVAIALLEKGLEFDVQMDAPWAVGTVTPHHNPLEQLPILIAGDETLFDSGYIVEWIETRYPTPPLLPASMSPQPARLAQNSQPRCISGEPARNWLRVRISPSDRALNSPSRIAASRMRALRGR